MTRLAGATALGVCLALATPARADERPTVCVAAKRLPAGVTLAELVAHLGAGLKGARVEPCGDPKATPEGQAPPRATRVLVDATGTQVSIDVEDPQTGKSLTRSFEVRALPADSRAVAVALYGEELVLASWAETLLEKQRRRAPVVRELVAKRAEPPRALPLFVGVGLRGALFTGGVIDLGPAAELGARASLFEAALGFTARFAPDRASVHGSVAERSFSVGASVGLALPIGPLVRLRPLAAAELVLLSVEGRPAPGQAGSSATLAAGALGGGLGCDLQLGSQAALSSHLKVLGVAYSAEARDAGAPVLAVSGLGLDLGLGLRVSFGPR